jgi:hypothetical protein
MISLIPLGIATTKNICMAPTTYGVDEPELISYVPGFMGRSFDTKTRFACRVMQFLMANVTIGYLLLLQALS